MVEDNCDQVNNNFSTKFTKRGSATKRLFGQADDLWALSMTTLESWYKIHPIVKLQKEKAEFGESITTLEAIKNENFLEHFKKSSFFSLLARAESESESYL